MFEYLKETAKEYRKGQGTRTGTLLETGVITAVSAGSAGSVAAWITTPVDVIKTRIMLSAARESPDGKTVAGEPKQVKADPQSLDKLATDKGTPRKSGMVIAREVIVENGIKGLFRGGALRAAWTALGSGLYLGVYECGRVWLKERHDSDD